ncbi:uncharacterized protein LOC144495190 isoform X1 [Mustelus asterias]
MSSLYFVLSAVLLSVSVRGLKHSLNDWSMTVADEVSVGDGGSAVLPCTFTHPPTNRTLTGSVIWFTRHPTIDPGKNKTIFNCTYPGTAHPRGELCESGKQRDGGSRFRFLGNLSNNDVSIMMERLSREESELRYYCRVELNIDKFQITTGTALRLRDASGNDLVVNGTEGASVTLPCMFTPHSDYSMTNVSWMRKEPYQHVVTFRVQSDGSWTTVNGGNRYEFIGNLKEGNASIRINQLSVNDDDTYLCLVEYTSSNSHHLILNETRLQVIHVRPTFKIYQLVISLLILLLVLLIIFIICRKKGGYSWLIECTRSSKREDQGSSSAARTDRTIQQPASAEDSSCTYADINKNRTVDKRVTISASEDAQPDSCTYASLVIDGNRKVQGGKNLQVADSEENVTYAAVVSTV